MGSAQTFFEINEIPSVQDFLKEGIKIIMFGAQWCQPCLKQRSVLEDVFNNMKDKAGFAYIDVDLNMDLPIEYNVSSIPATLIFKDGKMEEISTGVISQLVIEDKIRTLM